MAKILLLSHIYPPAIDGGSRSIAKMGDYFQKKGHQILVLTSNCTSTDDFVNPNHACLSHPKNIISLPIYTFFHRPLKLLAKIFPPLRVFSKGPLFCLFPFLKAIFAVKKFKPDFILAGPLPTTIVFYARFFARLTQAKLIINPCFHPKDPDFQNPFLIKTLNQADFLWCLTDFEKNYFLTHFHITSPQYFVHGLGTDTSFLLSGNPTFPNNLHLLFIANFSAHKRAELLIEAFNQTLKKYPQASLTLLGQKTLYFPKLEKIFKQYPVKTKKQIKFIFNPSRQLIIDSIDRSSFLVLPSIHESFGIVFIESLARKKPVIGANTPQTSEVLNRLKGGLLFQTDSVKDLSQKISYLFSHQNLCRTLGQHGYQIVKYNYTWDKIGEALCKKLAI